MLRIARDKGRNCEITRQKFMAALNPEDGVDISDDARHEWRVHPRSSMAAEVLVE